MRYSTYQNKKLKAIQIEALKAWLMYDFEKMDEGLKKRDEFEKHPNVIEYQTKYKNKPDNYHVMPY